MLVARGEVPILPHAYLVAWLVLVSLPLGALPVLMGLELLRCGDHPLAAPLRLLLAALPLLAVLFAPILLGLQHIYGWAPGSTVALAIPRPTGFASAWFTPRFFDGRAIAYLLVWIALGLPFRHPLRSTPARRALAGAGLLVHLTIGTLAAVDWFMSLDQAFVSSAYGALIMAAQVAFALAVAVLALVLRAPVAAPDRSSVVALLVAVAVAAFFQGTEYLVIWSANLPKEIIWYQTRAQDGLGPAFAIVMPVAVALATVVLLPPPVAARPLPALAAVALLVLAAIADLIWLASPRDTFTGAVMLLDIFVLVGLAGAAAVSALLLGDRTVLEPRHG